MNIKYITNGMSDPKGKPKVFFSCHPADFGEVFPLLVRDILAHSNCAVWYDADMAVSGESLSDGTSRETSEYGDDLNDVRIVIEEMQLVVFAVTSRFLYDSHRAKDVELPFALEHNIPILPILMENDIAYQFSNICAEIQVVQKYGNDPTAIPYDEVLQKFLDSVLVGDELAEKVRNAFDAYVFLSYRKKDRKYAQKLMRLIHENKAYRDIAIWYDEFLVPGEDFNENIAKAFWKSSIFVMAVTPHLEEDGNYVMRIEYPMARDRETDDNSFGIVPVEMYEPEDSIRGKEWRINQDRLKGHNGFKYKDIRNLNDEHRPDEMNQSLIRVLAGIAKKDNDGSAVHRFFIGLAYLYGIDMEINRDRALELLQSAAKEKEPCIEATEKLADMYLTGDGVRLNLMQAILWQKEAASQYRTAYDRNHNPDEHKGYGTSYFKALRKLSDMYMNAGKIQEASDTALLALSFCEELEKEVGTREKDRDKALIMNQLGNIYLDMDYDSEAEECFTVACEIYEHQNAEISTARVRRDLSIAFEKLGNICRKRGDLSGADKYYEKVREIRQELLSDDPTPFSRRDLSSILTKLGNVRKKRNDLSGARRYYAEALSMDQMLAEEIKSPQAWDDYAVSILKEADITKAEGNLRAAEENYRRACEIFRKNAEKRESLLFEDHLACACEKLAVIKADFDEIREAEEYFREAMALRERLYEKRNTVSNAHALASDYYTGAQFFDDREMMKKAYDIWQRLSLTHPEYIRYRDKAAGWKL